MTTSPPILNANSGLVLSTPGIEGGNLDYQALKTFYESELIPSFPERSHGQLRHDFPKHAFEVGLLVQAMKGRPGRKTVLDVGAGAGINAIILSKFCGFQSYVIDRYDEFNETLDRSVGCERSIAQNLKSFGVAVVKRDFVKDGFHFDPGFFDAIGCFDVVEHFTFSPVQVLSSMASLLKPGGALLIGTPNQVHLVNRIKAFFGKNTWEDFEYYLTSETFYGHVRELTPAELAGLLGRVNGVKFSHLSFSDYPFHSRLKSMPSGGLRLLLTTLLSLYGLVTWLVPNLKYYMVGVAHRTR